MTEPITKTIQEAIETFGEHEVRRCLERLLMHRATKLRRTKSVTTWNGEPLPDVLRVEMCEDKHLIRITLLNGSLFLACYTYNKASMQFSLQAAFNTDALGCDIHDIREFIIVGCATPEYMAWLNEEQEIEDD